MLVEQLSDLMIKSRVTETGCIEWTGARRQDGYGVVKIGERLRRVHRVAWEIKHGAIPDGAFICHRCDNPPCFNPSHLFVGDAIINVADMVHKKRQRAPLGDANGQRTRPDRRALGSRVGNALLDDDVVRLIRRRAASRESHAVIAEDVGVSVACIWMVVSRRRWQHVT